MAGKPIPTEWTLETVVDFCLNADPAMEQVGKTREGKLFVRILGNVIESEGTCPEDGDGLGWMKILFEIQKKANLI